MDITTLKARIQSRQLSSYLIFSGPEWKVQQIYIQQIAKVLNKSIRYVDAVADIYSQFKNKSFIQQYYVYVVRDDKDLLTNEKLQQQIDNGLLGKNTLIHLLTSVDKRTKFYKQYKDTIIEFEPLNSEILKKYIQREIALSDKNCERLIVVCEQDYGRILLEIDKIKRYVNYLGPAPMFDGVFEKLLKDGTIYQPPYDAVFDFVDAVVARKVNTTFNLLQQCNEIGESVLVMLSVLYNKFKAMLQVKTCTSKNIEASTGLTAWQIKSVRDYINKYSVDELTNALKVIHKCEKGLKSGTIEEQFIMDYVLIKILERK